MAVLSTAPQGHIVTPGWAQHGPGAPHSPPALGHTIPKPFTNCRWGWSPWGWDGKNPKECSFSLGSSVSILESLVSSSRLSSANGRGGQVRLRLHREMATAITLGVRSGVISASCGRCFAVVNENEKIPSPKPNI